MNFAFFVATEAKDNMCLLSVVFTNPRTHTHTHSRTDKGARRQPVWFIEMFSPACNVHPLYLVLATFKALRWPLFLVLFSEKIVQFLGRSNGEKETF